MALFYAPMLRDQIRNGEIGIPFGTINPIRLRRDDHPLAFYFCATAMILAVAGLVAVSVLLLVQAVQ